MSNPSKVYPGVRNDEQILSLVSTKETILNGDYNSVVYFALQEVTAVIHGPFTERAYFIRLLSFLLKHLIFTTGSRSCIVLLADRVVAAFRRVRSVFPNYNSIFQSRESMSACAV